MAVDVTINHRQPTVYLPRPTGVEIGGRINCYWNGSRATDGDGLPGGEAGAIDYDNPLTAAPIDIWASGHAHLFGGGFGVGGFAEPGAKHNAAMGFATGPFGIGSFGLGGGYWEWTFPFALRDGIYKVAMRVLDSLGNERQAADAILTLEVAALPRSAANATFTAYDDQADTLDFGWRASPDMLVA